MKKIINLKINEADVKAEVDTGCPIILIGSQLYRQHFKTLRLQPFTRPLFGASGHPLQILGAFSSTIAANKRSGEARIVVQSGIREFPLLGTEGLDIIFPGWEGTFDVSRVVDSINNEILEFIKTRFKKVCDQSLSEPIKNFTINLHLRPGAIPVFARSRPIPYGLMDKFSDKIRQMVGEGILVPVKDTARANSSWASPLVVIRKPNGGIRICIDPKRTLNPHLAEDHYPLPVIEDLLVKVGGRKVYSLIDLTGAFQQLKLTPESSKLVAINTPLGIFEYTRLPFGIKTASAVFQRFMDHILEGLPWASVYIDDVLVTACSEEKMRHQVTQVFEILEKYNVKVNIKKSVFCVTSIKYLGHEISEKGISPSEDKMSEIIQCKIPQNLKELQSYLGLVNYFQKFIPNLSKKLSPMLNLLKSNTPYSWGAPQQSAFEAIKREFSSKKVLIHYNSKKVPVICCDASDLGIAAVLCHEIDTGSGYEDTLAPVMFKSRTLTPAEKNYPILHRELLAVVFAFEKFYKYVLGKHTKLFTDHKPLVPILKAGLSLATVTTRVQRYLLRLNPFDFQVFYLKGKHNALADFPSRFPTHAKQSELDELEEKNSTTINCLEDQQPIKFSVISDQSRQDKVILELKDAIISGKGFDSLSLQPYKALKESLSIVHDVILYDGRIVIPQVLQQKVVDMLHDQHLGVVRMKQLGRKYFFWPGMPTLLEKKARSCEICKTYNPDTASKLFVPWPEPKSPFERVHVDFFHLDSRTFLILIDAFSRWVEVTHMRKTDAVSVIYALSIIFTRFGEPRLIVSDNGPPFNSKEFEQFCKDQQIELLHSPPYNPQSNGSAERWVRTVKEMMKKNLSSFSEESLQKLLFSIRNSPTTKDGFIPSERLLAYKPRDKFVKLFPSTSKGEWDKVKEIPKHREFHPGQLAMLKVQNGSRIKCQIMNKIGNAIYTVQVNGTTRTAHANQLVRLTESEAESSRDSTRQDQNEIQTRQLRPRSGIKPPTRYKY